MSEKEIRKIKQKLTSRPGARPTHLNRPSPPGGGTCVFFPSRQAGTSPATAVGTTGSCLPALSPISSLETSGRRPDLSPSLQNLLLLLPCSFPSPPEDS